MDTEQTEIRVAEIRVGDAPGREGVILTEKRFVAASGGWQLWVRDLLISAAASVLIILFLYQPVRVEGTRMLPRLENQDRLFINKFIYHFSAIKHGDVVVFHYPLNPKVSYIKRIAAVPGDRFRIDRGQVFVNGQPLPEPYVPAEYRDTRSYDPIIVPKGEYFVL